MEILREKVGSHKTLNPVLKVQKKKFKQGIPQFYLKPAQTTRKQKSP
jgi:hypothetical protein